MQCMQKEKAFPGKPLTSEYMQQFFSTNSTKKVIRISGIRFLAFTPQGSSIVRGLHLPTRCYKGL